MQAIVADKPATLDVYGLQPARTTVTATGAGTTLAQVFLGSPSGETAVHMRDASRPIVFTVDKALADDLQRQADAYRAKDVFAFRPFNLTRLVVTRGDTSRTFEKKTTGTGAEATDTWSQTAPANPGVTATTIDDITSRLSTMRAEAWASEPRDATPVFSVVATYDGGKEERVAIVQAGDQMFAVRTGEPGAARLTAPAVTDILGLLDPATATATPSPTPAPGTTP